LLRPQGTTRPHISQQWISEHAQDHDPSSTLVISPMPLLSRENASHQSFVAIADYAAKKSSQFCKKIHSMLQKILNVTFFLYVAFS
jgi:hypothetical protein